MNIKILVCGLILLASTAAEADIAQPDAIVYGALRVDGEVAGPGDDHIIVARVAGMAAPVSVYRMGDNPAAGDRYVLHIPHAVREDGRTPSPATPKAGALAEIHVINSASGNEVHAGNVAVPASGKTTQLDLSVSSKDLHAGYALNDSSSNGCGSGSGMCGSVGVIPALVMLCGLVQMKRRTKH